MEAQAQQYLAILRSNSAQMAFNIASLETDYNRNQNSLAIVHDNDPDETSAYWQGKRSEIIALLNDNVEKLSEYG